ncbi:hypothetical protein Moror_2820 [Moniliophthora roreri MCA 2997]|uniref:Uncharacterized protein n=2 Tax=Moniliophthora roreri TaxID=221103 RepID=V2XEP4_MONRO|nr:hypothetical protein Moror_2820 [Moniliophthora roreri MCA 2997]KAI3601654.1 hypothetical protein WG66_009018 [Moniliophthora roreri]
MSSQLERDRPTTLDSTQEERDDYNHTNCFMPGHQQPCRECGDNQTLNDPRARDDQGSFVNLNMPSYVPQQEQGNEFITYVDGIAQEVLNDMRVHGPGGVTEVSNVSKAIVKTTGDLAVVQNAGDLIMEGVQMIATESAANRTGRRFVTHNMGNGVITNNGSCIPQEYIASRQAQIIQTMETYHAMNVRIQALNAQNPAASSSSTLPPLVNAAKSGDGWNGGLQ